jgi:hypothetical protein
MDTRPMTCELVDELDVDVRYLAGRLDEAEAAAFEEHVFGCERCWALVRGGVAVRAAGESASAAAVAPAPGSGGTGPAPRWAGGWRPLALAAGLAAVAFGVWRVSTGGGPEGADVLRGAGSALPVAAELTATGWRVSWPAVTDAGSYRVRIYSEDGMLRLEREVTDTVLAGSSADLGGPGPFLADVEALDAVRGAAARSGLTPFRGPPPD